MDFFDQVRDSQHSDEQIESAEEEAFRRESNRRIQVTDESSPTAGPHTPRRRKTRRHKSQSPAMQRNSPVSARETAKRLDAARVPSNSPASAVQSREAGDAGGDGDIYEFIDENDVKFSKFGIDTSPIDFIVAHDLLTSIDTNAQMTVDSYKEKMFYVLCKAKRPDFWLEAEDKGDLPIILDLMAMAVNYDDVVARMISLMTLYCAAIRSAHFVSLISQPILMLLKSTQLLLSREYDYDRSFRDFVKIYSGLTLPDDPAVLPVLIMLRIFSTDSQVAEALLENGSLQLVTDALHSHIHNLRWLEEATLLASLRFVTQCFTKAGTTSEAALKSIGTLISDLIVLEHTASVNIAAAESMAPSTQRTRSVKLLEFSLKSLVSATDIMSERRTDIVTLEELQTIFNDFVEWSVPMLDPQIAGAKKSVKGEKFEVLLHYFGVFINVAEDFRTRRLFATLSMPNSIDEEIFGHSADDASLERRHVPSLRYFVTLFLKFDENCSLENEVNRSFEDNVVFSYAALLLGLLSRDVIENRIYIRQGLPSQTFDTVTRALLEFVGMHSRVDALSPRMFKLVNDIIQDLRPTPVRLRDEE